MLAFALAAYYSFSIHYTPSPQYKFLRQAPRDGLSTAMQPSRWQRLHIDPWLCSFDSECPTRTHSSI
jgi:hypothetical protein